MKVVNVWNQDDWIKFIQDEIAIADEYQRWAKREEQVFEFTREIVDGLLAFIKRTEQLGFEEEGEE